MAGRKQLPTAHAPNPNPVMYPEADFLNSMTIQVTLKPDVASVLAACLRAQGSCCTHDEIAQALNVDEVEHMDRKLLELADYIEDHAPALPNRC